MRLIIAIILILAFGVPVYGAAVTPEAAPIELRFSLWGTGARHEAMLNALEIFEARYPNVRIFPEFGYFAGYHNTQMTQLAAGTAPDIMMTHAAWVHQFAGYAGGNNPFFNLNDLSHILDLSEWSPEMLSFTTTADGQLAAVPHGLTGRVILYNTEMLAEHGFDAFPETFDQWLELGRRVSSGNAAVDAGGNQYAFFPTSPEALDIMLLTMLYNETGYDFYAGGKILYTPEQVERAFNILEAMESAGAMPSFAQQEPPNDFTNPIWTQGRAGSAYSWVGNIFLYGGSFMNNWGLGETYETTGLGAALLPAVTEGGSRSIMQRPSLTFAISPTSANPEMAAYLLNFLFTDEDALVEIAYQLGVPFSRTAAAVAEREGRNRGLLLEGMGLLEENFAAVHPLFEHPQLRRMRFMVIEAFRAGEISAEEAAARWVGYQQEELDDWNIPAAVPPPIREEINRIGISMPTRDPDGWRQDGENLEAMLTAAGFEANLQFAERCGVLQRSQIEDMLASGADMLIIAPVAEPITGWEEVLTEARANGIPVISFVRLIMNSAAVTYYVAFDNFMAGQMQGEFIRGALDLPNRSEPVYMEFFTATPDDMLFAGAIYVLQPYLEDGTVVVLSGQTDGTQAAIPDLSQQTARQRMEELIRMNNYAPSGGQRLDSVLVSYDSIAEGVTAALQDAGFTAQNFPIITGSEGTAMHNIIAGYQAMTILKDSTTIAESTVDMVLAIAEGRPVPVSDTIHFDNGMDVIPTLLIEPALVTIQDLHQKQKAGKNMP